MDYWTWCVSGTIGAVCGVVGRRLYKSTTWSRARRSAPTGPRTSPRYALRVTTTLTGGRAGGPRWRLPFSE